MFRIVPLIVPSFHRSIVPHRSIGAIIGANPIITCDTIGAIGDNLSFIGDIDITFYDISIQNDNLEWYISTEKELCRGVSVIFMASSQKNGY